MKYTSPREFVIITLLPMWHSENAFLRKTYFKLRFMMQTKNDNYMWKNVCTFAVMKYEVEYFSNNILRYLS